MNINEKWEQIPTFDDPSAKIETRVHPVSGSEIIEVLYGAAAAESVPTAQDNSQQGRWIAFKADGLCQLLYWRLPDGEVKQAFVSGSSEQPEITLEILLKTLEQSIRARKSIIDEAYTLNPPPIHRRHFPPCGAAGSSAPATALQRNKRWNRIGIKPSQNMKYLKVA